MTRIQPSLGSTDRRATTLLVALLLSTALGCESMISRMVDAAVARQISAGRQDLLTDDALSVFLCGTGSPLADPDAAAACTMVFAGGKAYVVDVGPGSQEVAQLAGMPREKLAGIFLTHFHSDHIGELGEWAMQSWVAGRSQALDFYGPEGVEQVVGGFRDAYRLDDGYRIEHHGADLLPPSGTEWVVHTVPSANGPGSRILEDGDLVVTAFGVDHEPVAPAVGYRFDYRGRSVVISGDTDVSDSVVVNSKDADLLLHEVLLKSLIRQVSDRVGESGYPRQQRLAADVLDYHTSPGEAAEAAERAGVDTLVFTHIVPPLPGAVRNWLFMREVDVEDVDVMLGEDGMIFRLPAGSDEIDIES